MIRDDATLGGDGKRSVSEILAEHVPLRADDYPAHEHQGGDAADDSPQGRRPRHQHSQGEDADHRPRGYPVQAQRNLEDVAQTVEHCRRCHAKEAEEYHQTLQIEELLFSYLFVSYLITLACNKDFPLRLFSS